MNMNLIIISLVLMVAHGDPASARQDMMMTPFIREACVNRDVPVPYKSQNTVCHVVKLRSDSCVRKVFSRLANVWDTRELIPQASKTKEAVPAGAAIELMKQSLCTNYTPVKNILSSS
ncbi:MAG: hypothetical protein ABSH12_08745 [Endomicrobiales bacterium]